MGRAPCCDKVGLKKGPWTPEEDQILISFIQQHGHSNWRALPKQAGLLRCGKSCRLRWINYLRPDIKRGNFTKEEEDTIIQLHEMMGNRWSAIAARLPGRTDNEIKNVWHTHLKKRLEKYQTTSKINATPKRSQAKNVTTTTTTTNSTSTTTNNFTETISGGITSDHQSFPNSPQQSYTSDGYSSVTEVSSVEVPSNMSTLARKEEINLDDIQEFDMDYEFPIIDETFWSSEEFSSNESEVTPVFENVIDDNQLQFPDNNNALSGTCNDVSSMYNTNCLDNNNMVDDNMDFWLDVFVKAGGVPELPEF